jgi:hypothetical protein
MLLAGLFVNGCRISKLLSSSPQAKGPLVVDPTAVVDSALVGTSAARLANLNVSNSGGWSATSKNSWIRLTPSSGGSRGTVRLSLDPKSLTPGMHQGAVTVSDKNADSESVTVDVSFLILQPILSVDPDNLSYQARTSNSVFNDTVRVANKGNGPLTWTARIAHGSDWITLGTTSGDGPGQIAVRASNEGLNYFATYRDTILVEAPGAKNSPARIPVQIKRKH